LLSSPHLYTSGLSTNRCRQEAGPNTRHAHSNHKKETTATLKSNSRTPNPRILVVVIRAVIKHQLQLVTKVGPRLVLAVLQVAADRTLSTRKSLAAQLPHMPGPAQHQFRAAQNSHQNHIDVKRLRYNGSVVAVRFDHLQTPQQQQPIDERRPSNELPRSNSETKKTRSVTTRSHTTRC
jgi:hypothetical protein